MNRFLHRWLVAALCGCAGLVGCTGLIGCTEAPSQIPSSITEGELQQIKADEQRVATEELARRRQGL